VGDKEVPKNSSAPAGKNSEAKLRNETLGDFTTTRRVIPISALAMVIGLRSAGFAPLDRVIYQSTFTLDAGTPRWFPRPEITWEFLVCWCGSPAR
jgi:hypothetical protein